MDERRKLLVFADGNPRLKVRIETLVHPKTGRLVKYAMDGDMVFEMQVVQTSKPGSWIIGDRFKSDSQIIICTPIDPLFLVINELHEHRNVFVPLSQFKTGNMSILKLDEKYLSRVCEFNSVYDENMKLVKINPDKLHLWMNCKLDKAAQAMSSSRNASSIALVGAAVSSFSHNFAANLNDTQLECLHRQQGLEILSEYLSEQNLAILKSTMPVTEKENTTENKRPLVNTSCSKPQHQEVQVEEPPKKKKPQPSLAQRKLERIDVRGMSSLSSFFNKEKV